MRKRQSLADVKKKAKTRAAKRRPIEGKVVRGDPIHYVFVTTSCGHEILLFAEKRDAQKRAVEEALGILKDALDEGSEEITDVQDAYDAGLYESALKLADIPETDDQCNVEIGEAVLE